jgi:hypothetical protein
MGRPSPRFGRDPIQWRAYVRRVHPVTAMAQYLRRLLRGEVLPSFHFTGEPAVDFVALSWPLDELLLEAALRKLAAQCRVPIAGELDALIAGGIVRVIRANPDRALRQLEHLFPLDVHGPHPCCTTLRSPSGLTSLTPL